MGELAPSAPVYWPPLLTITHVAAPFETTTAYDKWKKETENLRKFQLSRAASTLAALNSLINSVSASPV